MCAFARLHAPGGGASVKGGASIRGFLSSRFNGGNVCIRGSCFENFFGARIKHVVGHQRQRRTFLRRRMRWVQNGGGDLAALSITGGTAPSRADSC